MLRKPLPDLMKGVAIIMMVQVHLMEQFAAEELYMSAFGDASLFLGGPFAAPVFMAVMGYFIAASKRSPISKLKRGVGLLGLGLLLNIGMNAHLFIREPDAIDPWSYILGVDILWLAGLSIIIITLLSEWIGKGRWYVYLSLALAVSLLADLSRMIPEIPGWPAYGVNFLWRETAWSYFPLFPWMSYPLAGYAYYLFQKQEEDFLYRLRRHKTMFLPALIMVVVAGSVYAFRIATDLERYYHHGFFFFLWMLAFLPAWAMILEYLEELGKESRINKYLRWLGRNVTSVYFIQWLMIGNLATVLHGTQFLLQLTGWFLLILPLTSLLVWWIGKLRIRI